MLTRRDFLKASAASVLLPVAALASHDLPWTPGKVSSQSLSINLPSYELTVLTSYAGNNIVGYNLAVGIGSVDNPTPVCRGIVRSKLERILFREGTGCPVVHSSQALQAYDIMHYHNSFDANGMPFFFNRIDYDNMRAIAAGSEGSKDVMVYSLLNPNAVGIPSGGPCIGLTPRDMLVLYDNLQDGKHKISFETTYDIVHFRPIRSARPLKNGRSQSLSLDRTVVLHADVYSRQPSYYEAFLKAAGPEGIDLNIINHDKSRQLLKETVEGFSAAQERIRRVLSRSHPDNFVDPSLKAALHKRMNLSEFFG
ncbi:MAG: twin-arginine translocation signal domain-containing protein [Candidatus Woesearchaeota archaeon]